MQIQKALPRTVPNAGIEINSFQPSTTPSLKIHNFPWIHEPVRIKSRLDTPHDPNCVDPKLFDKALLLPNTYPVLACAGSVVLLVLV